MWKLTKQNPVIWINIESNCYMAPKFCEHVLESSESKDDDNNLSWVLHSRKYAYKERYTNVTDYVIVCANYMIQK